MIWRPGSIIKARVFGHVDGRQGICAILQSILCSVARIDFPSMTLRGLHLFSLQHCSERRNGGYANFSKTLLEQMALISSVATKLMHRFLFIPPIVCHGEAGQSLYR